MHANEVIRDPPWRAGEDRLTALGHVASYTVAGRVHRADFGVHQACRLAALRRRVAPQARRRIFVFVCSDIGMRIVAGQAGKPILALPETPAPLQAVSLEKIRMLQREVLVQHLPLGAMTASAELVN